MLVHVLDIVRKFFDLLSRINYFFYVPKLSQAHSHTLPVLATVYGDGYVLILSEHNIGNIAHNQGGRSVCKGEKIFLVRAK